MISSFAVLFCLSLSCGIVITPETELIVNRFLNVKRGKRGIMGKVCVLYFWSVLFFYSDVAVQL